MSNNDDEKGGKGQRYRLTVPLDASELEELRDEKPQDLQVVGRLPDGTSITETVVLEQGEGVADLEFEDRPDGVGVFVGPDRATTEELVKSQTITANLPGDRWVDTPEVELEPIRIPAYYWDWWYRWCREFVIRGKLQCPDGSPVPNAKVCAKDIDAWFIWSSTEDVGCDTTDKNGAFEIRFRWCCGFWPRWWWQNRVWQPDPLLIDQIQSLINEEPDLPLAPTLARAGMQPSLEGFADLLDNPPFTLDQPLPELDPNRLERIRSQLTERLPDIPELRRLHVWPWVQWQPWWDCTPDIIFEATQSGDVVLDEGIDDTRWDIANPEDVILTANEEARCIQPPCWPQDPPCPGGECTLVTSVCGVDIEQIGGNLGAGATPEDLEGYKLPGDCPFAGTVNLWRLPNRIQNIDYLEVEYKNDTDSDWVSVPGKGVKGFTIGYWIVRPDGSLDDRNASFRFEEEPDKSGDEHLVVETREHYKDTKADPGFVGWDGRVANLLLKIDSSSFKDGTYSFRFVGWEDVGSGDDVELERLGVVTRCPEEEQTPVEVTLTFDNRSDVPVPSHDHPTASPGSGTGTVHKPYVEPDTSISAVRIIDSDGNVTEVPEDEDDECPSVEEQEGTLQIDFIARDRPDNPKTHLSHYSLRATFGRSKTRNLLNKDSTEITLRGSGYTGHKSGMDRATYSQALDDGAPRPEWEGGEYRLEIDLNEAFPKPCCYQLELRAWKRTIVNCSSRHWNISEYSIGYGV